MSCGEVVSALGLPWWRLRAWIQPEVPKLPSCRSGYTVSTGAGEGEAAIQDADRSRELWALKPYPCVPLKHKQGYLYLTSCLEQHLMSKKLIFLNMKGSELRWKEEKVFAYHFIVSRQFCIRKCMNLLKLLLLVHICVSLCICTPSASYCSAGKISILLIASNCLYWLCTATSIVLGIFSLIMCYVLFFAVCISVIFLFLFLKCIYQWFCVIYITFTLKTLYFKCLVLVLKTSIWFYIIVLYVLSLFSHI